MAILLHKTIWSCLRPNLSPKDGSFLKSTPPEDYPANVRKHRLCLARITSLRPPLFLFLRPDMVTPCLEPHSSWGDVSWCHRLRVQTSHCLDHQVLHFCLFIMYLPCFISGRVCVPQCACRGQKTASRSQFSLYQLGPRFETQVWAQVPLSAKPLASSTVCFCFLNTLT